MSITLLLSDAEIKRLVELDMTERAYLCNPLDIAAKRAELDRIMAFTAKIAARRAAIRAAIRPLVIEVTPDMISTKKSQPGIDIKQSSGVEIRVKGVPAQIPLPLEAA